MERDALAASIRDLERRKTDLEDELALTIRKLDKQRAQHASLLNKDSSPIYRLPNELLMSIFIMQHQDDLASRQMERKRCYHVRVLARVSQHWRQIIFGTPRLWNVIDFRLRSVQADNQRLLKVLDAHLLHSATHPLDITLEYLQTSNISEYLSRLVMHAPRWRRVSILALDEPQEAEKMLREAHTPNLEYLSVTTGPVPTVEGAVPAIRSHRRAMSISPSICVTSTNSLRFVRLAGHALGCMYPPLAAVTVLHLDGWAQPLLTEHDIVQVLQQTPQLKHLSLNKLTLYHSRDPLTPQPVATLRHLHSLRMRGPCSPPSRFFSIIHAPALQSLALYQIPVIKSVSLPSVWSLTLDGCPMDAQDIRELTQMMPAITHLDVDDDMPAIFRVLNPDVSSGGGGSSSNSGSSSSSSKSAAPAWPHLRELKLNYLTSADVSDLCAFLIARRCSPKTRAVGTVYLDRRSRLSLRQRNSLETVQAVATVRNYDQLDDVWPAGLVHDDVHDCFV